MKTFALFWLLIICIGCSNSTPKSKIVVQYEPDPVLNVYNLDTLKLLLNKNINEIKSCRFPLGVSLKDTIFESEDEAQWKGVVFYNKSLILLIVEASWENANIAKRITVLSSDIVGMKGLKIGAKFLDIKSDLSQTIPSYPDGYFGLKIKNDKQVTCFFNISNNKNFSVGNVKFETIPDDIVVEQILVE